MRQSLFTAFRSNVWAAMFFVAAGLIASSPVSTWAGDELQDVSPQTPVTSQAADPDPNSAPEPATAIVAGGCFWCVETDFEKAPGILDVVSGYSGGRTKSPNYKSYSSGGHREVVLVTYDPTKISYAGITEWLIKHIDPTDAQGQFNDRGHAYSPAIFFADDAEEAEAKRVIEVLDASKAYRTKIRVEVLKRMDFWPAEEYHQNYHHKNTVKYSWFRFQSGRDKFVNGIWGKRASMLQVEGSVPAQTSEDDGSEKSPLAEWTEFEKPSQVELRKKLTPMQFKVTQQDGTERAFGNAYHRNKKPGLYVDVVSGSPLFSSKTKFDSGTGWPSFTAPIVPEVVFYHMDRKMFTPRTEVRSRFGDSHLGHVFNDGPTQAGGKRYCMNSAAMRFVPLKDMEKEGYGAFLEFVE